MTAEIFKLERYWGKSKASCRVPEGSLISQSPRTVSSPLSQFIWQRSIVNLEVVATAVQFDAAGVVVADIPVAGNFID